jgi:hypothetical protein
MPKVEFTGIIGWTLADGVSGSPWWGCYVVGNAQHASQFDFNAGMSFRFYDPHRRKRREAYASRLSCSLHRVHR